MADITPASVAKLREMTGAGMMACKQALVEAKGDLTLAVEILRKRGIASAERKATREARQGVIAQFIQPGGQLGVLAEVNCETDFVAKNETFRSFADDVAKTLAAQPQADFEAERTALIAKTGENVKIARHMRMEVAGNGMIAAYIHTGAKVGVLVEVGAENASSITQDEFKQFVRDITLQVAAASPIVVDRSQVPETVIAKEREIAAEQVKNKPPQAIAKIVEGKLEKFFQGYCLLDQGFVKQNSEITVNEHLTNVSKKIGGALTIRRFVRFQVGEQLQAQAQS